MKDSNTRLGGSFPTIWPWVLFFCLHYVWAYIFPRLIISCSVLFCTACFSFLYSDCSESTENWSRQSKKENRTNNRNRSIKPCHRTNNFLQHKWWTCELTTTSFRNWLLEITGTANFEIIVAGTSTLATVFVVFFQFFCLFFFLLNFFSCCQKKLFHFSPNYDSILRWKIILLKDHLWWCSVYGSCFCSCHSVSYSLQFKRKCTGVSFTLQVEHSGEVSVSILLFWPFSIDCPLFNLVILEIPFLEVFFRRVPLVLNFLWDMLRTMSLYFVFWVFPSSSPYTYGEHFVTLLYFRWW